VGQALIAAVENQGWPWSGTGNTHLFQGGPRPLLPLDVRNSQALEACILNQEPEAIFIPAGWTWVDGCESDPERALLENATAPAQAAKAAAQLGARFVYYSTEYVFDGVKGPYDEDASVHPLGAYARSKLEGERLVLAANPRALILRTTVVYGPEPQGKNFIYQLRSSLSAGKAMQVPEDQVSNPTYNRDLARASVELVKFGFSGIWNVAGKDRVGRMEFARKACETFGLDAGLLQPVKTADLKQKSARPLDAGLLSGRLEKALGWHPRGIEAGLKSMKAELG
jgi:dTDP-4-dehydrorhamnose reductase